ncbi:MAG: gamma-glutamyltransferase [Acidobacteria bacterium]|jgi:gamma-glutamyltranspeptidase/glutathione hydrolase|nr:gamma-glutamyltransferase [Acidobacteriota bacterium]
MKRLALLLLPLLTSTCLAEAGSVPVRARNSMVVSQNAIASQVGASMLIAEGNAMDAAVATAFALAVVMPSAGNIGGGGFLVYRPARGEPVAYDFRETAPARASPTMFLREGKYDRVRHHDSHLAVGVPGTVAGLHRAWSEHGNLPWESLVEPAIAIAREGFMVTDGLARSLQKVLPEMQAHPASLAQFSRGGDPYEMGDLLIQTDLADTLERIAEKGAQGFYEGTTARLIEKEMERGGGLITREDLKAYRALRRTPLRGEYRGIEVLTMPPPTSGGVVLLEVLNVLEEFDLPGMGFGSAAYLHHLAEAMRRAFADRARYLGDPDFVKDMPVLRLVSKEYAATLRDTIRPRRASVSNPSTFEWPAESAETTHLSVVDSERNAVSLTYTLEAGYGSKIVVPGAGFLLNNEMGDFNAGPGLTNAEGLIGTEPNLAAPRKRMLSSMTPTILVRDGRPLLLLGSPGARTIPSTVAQTIMNVVDFKMNVQEAIDAPRVHHQWLPDLLRYERNGFSPDTLDILREWGHAVDEVDSMGAVEAVAVSDDGGWLEGGSDRRRPDGAAIGR